MLRTSSRSPHFYAFKSPATPGSEWLYLRINAGLSLHEELLIKLQALIRDLKEADRIEDWFFVRYRDDQNHLRIRLKVPHERLFFETLATVCQWAGKLVHAGFCTTYSVNTYEREVERYGGVEGLRICESIFSIDSEFVADCLALPEFKKLDRTVVGLLSINALLESAMMNVNERFSWLDARRINQIKSQVANTYRQNRALFAELLFEPNDGGASQLYSSVISLLSTSRQRMTPLFKQLRHLENGGHLNGTTDNLCSSLVHMHCNRLYGINRDLELQTMALLRSSLETKIKRLQGS